ncbi:MAG: response regulator [Verrucomicrobiales bacterium]|nr:response regulator [Verrucomicrobiales bacterium]
MKEMLRILHLEDNARDAELIHSALQGAGIVCEWVLVAGADDFQSALGQGDYDLILSDYALAGYDGMSALDLVRGSNTDVPFIFVSGTLGEEAAVESLKTGATDYILKHRLSKLVPAVRRALNEAEQRAARKQADERLRLLETAIQQVTESIIITTADLDSPGPRIVFVNPGFTNITGYTADEVLGKTMRILHGPKTDQNLISRLLDSLARGEGFCGETIHYRKNGEEFHMQWSTVPLPDGQGRITHFVAVQQDVTERKQNEARLLRAQRLESIGALASGIAHDLNNILAPIMMSAPMLRWNLPAHDSEEILTSIETSAQRGAELVKQLLLFGRGMEAKRCTTDLKHLIRDLLQMIRETFPKGIMIEARVSPELWTVQGDATQLHQVLLNLCVNARDAMPSGGKITLLAENLRLTPSATQHSGEPGVGDYVRLRVRDTGTGIPAGVLERIFDPFFTTKEPGSGTGLGLSTALGIVKKHGGFLEVQSQVDEGSTFSVHLPATPGVTAPALDLQPSKPLTQGNGELVLVVDDEPEILKATDQYLTRNGYRTLLARDGVDALVQFTQRQKEIQLLVTDLEMPLMDGVALTRAIRKLNPSIQVVVSSGIADDRNWLDRLAELAESGGYALLTKPYGVEKLLDTLKEASSKP